MGDPLDPSDSRDSRDSRDKGDTGEIPLLPINQAVLGADPRLLATVSAINTRFRFDYTDDTATAAMLADHRDRLRKHERGPMVWWGGLALTVGIVWPFLAPTIPAVAARPLLTFGPAAPLLLLAAWLLLTVRRRWKRELLHPELVGYREVLGVARAHGAPVTHVPDWLVGRNQGGGGEGTVPVPSYAEVAPYTEEALPLTASAPAGPSTAPAPEIPVPAVPEKPANVTEFENLANQGGWHDEAGCIFVLGGVGGTIWALTADQPLGFGALVLLPLAVTIWLAGARQGRMKADLREDALAYVRELSAAQAAGAQLPELSPVLRKLLEEDAG